MQMIAEKWQFEVKPLGQKAKIGVKLGNGWPKIPPKMAKSRSKRWQFGQIWSKSLGKTSKIGEILGKNRPKSGKSSDQTTKIKVKV